NSLILMRSRLWSIFITLRGQIAPFVAPLPMVAFDEDESLRNALDKNPGCSTLVSFPAATRTEGLRGVRGATTVFESSFFVSFCASFTGLFFSNGFVSSILGLG